MKVFKKLKILGEKNAMPLNIYEPIIRKIESWISYEEKSPKSDYFKNKNEHDQFRKNNDLDCKLTNGNLYADTIFSLWIPLRLVLVSINRYEKIKKYGNINDKIDFLKVISRESILKELLPKSNISVIKLSRLFELGQERCNVMILKNRAMQSRGLPPFYDYMPYFLYECFDDGKFSKYFDSNEDLINWINDEKLNMFFKKYITKKDIIDLSKSGNIKKGIPNNIDDLLDNYISILEKRKIYL